MTMIYYYYYYFRMHSTVFRYTVYRIQNTVFIIILVIIFAA